MRGPRFRLLLITDRGAVSSGAAPRETALVEVVARALDGAAPGRVAVSLREKDLSARDMSVLAEALLRVTSDAGAPLLINDRVDVALAVGAAGVHLPASGIPPAIARELMGDRAIIGVSTHGVEEVRQASAGGADYVTFGPVFDTPSKRAFGPPVGLEALRRASGCRGDASIPVFGLGGIEPGRVADVLAHGAAGVACIRAVLCANDPAEVVARLST